MKEVYSFDIFDTCLIRACGSPNCIASIVANNILLNATPSSINDFILKRKEGEGRARDKFITSQKEDITIDDIYSQCDFSSLTDIDNDSIKKMEMTVEANMLIPILNIKEEINQLHAQGHSIIFISLISMPFSSLYKVLSDMERSVNFLHLKSEEPFVNALISRFFVFSFDISYETWINSSTLFL